jgi:ABC-type multidrug transport system ATPase subunit
MTEIFDRVVLVHEGRIAAVGEPDEVIKTYYELTG